MLNGSDRALPELVAGKKLFGKLLMEHEGFGGEFVLLFPIERKHTGRTMQ
ncbi:MAG: hypothetical protein M0O96_01065 [Desulforhopalus sp.]|nr:hypothetical protein [Desulforhopalus sp.]